MFQSVGAFEAKSQLSALLRAVQSGQRYTITVRGKPVADLVPSGTVVYNDKLAAITALRNFDRVRGVSGRDVDSWIADGRQR
ncbi:MAG: type II toxin-antitoxin system prevent-host-death family antitoxin [Rhodocyclaceae bacterium]|nr:type II toxin-antitoxin system prevent-host-death family antitoxin [Rhodocyclaceae bacterium]